VQSPLSWRPSSSTARRFHLSFKGMRDSVVFTNKRLIAINVQGLTGKKRDYTSLPYSKIQAWSIETAGRFDLDAELELWFSGLGRVRLDFKGQVDHSLHRAAHRKPRPLTLLPASRHKSAGLGRN